MWSNCHTGLSEQYSPAHAYVSCSLKKKKSIQGGKNKETNKRMNEGTNKQKAIYYNLSPSWQGNLFDNAPSPVIDETQASSAILHVLILVVLDLPHPCWGWLPQEDALLAVTGCHPPSDCWRPIQSIALTLHVTCMQLHTTVLRLSCNMHSGKADRCVIVRHTLACACKTFLEPPNGILYLA